MNIAEANALVGRVFSREGLTYTVTSASTRGEVCVWDPRANTLLRFDSRDTDTLVAVAGEAMSPFQIEGPAVISFSGGRTSAYMLRRILDEGVRPDVFVLFAD